MTRVYGGGQKPRPSPEWRFQGAPRAMLNTRTRDSPHFGVRQSLRGGAAGLRGPLTTDGNHVDRPEYLRQSVNAD